MFGPIFIYIRNRWDDVYLFIFCNEFWLEKEEVRGRGKETGVGKKEVRIKRRSRGRRRKVLEWVKAPQNTLCTLYFMYFGIKLRGFWYRGCDFEMRFTHFRIFQKISCPHNKSYDKINLVDRKSLS